VLRSELRANEGSDMKKAMPLVLLAVVLVAHLMFLAGVLVARQ
jgi:hypothetical protein